MGICKKKTYNLLSAGFFATFGLVLITLAFSFGTFSKHEVAYLNQISDDWQTYPFISLTVTKKDSCPAGTEELITKPWLGTNLMCVIDNYLSWSYYKGECNMPSKDDRREFRHLPALSPV